MHVRDATFEDCDAIGVGMKVVVDEGRWLATEAATELELANRFRQVILEGDPLLVLKEGGGSSARSACTRRRRRASSRWACGWRRSTAGAAAGGC
jgi:hypothetical protein